MTGTGSGHKMWSPDHVMREVPYTRKEEFSYNRVAASVKLMCGWDDRYNAAADLIQNFRPYPYNPEIGLDLYCTSANVSTPTSECWTTDLEEQVCEHPTNAYLDVNYQLVFTTFIAAKGPVARAEDPVTGDTVTVTETLTDVSEFQTQRISEIKWSNSGVLVNKDVPYPRYAKRYRLTRTEDGLSYIPSSHLWYSGKVNLAAYTSPILGITFAAETLLFDGLVISYNMLSQKYNFSFNLIYKDDGVEGSPKGWNYFYNPDTLEWDDWEDKDDVHVWPYTPTSFAGLLF